LIEFWAGYILSAAPITQPSSCVRSQERISWAGNWLGLEPRGLLFVYAWALVSLRDSGRIDLSWLCARSSGISLDLRDYNTQVSSLEECCEVAFAVFCEEQIGGLIDREYPKSSWSERLGLVRCPLSGRSTIDRKHIVHVHLVNENASSQFHDQSCGCYKNTSCVCVKICACMQTKSCTKAEKERSEVAILF
jgi:hypothetical protein